MSFDPHDWYCHAQRARAKSRNDAGLRQRIAELEEQVTEIPQICRRYDKLCKGYMDRIAELEAENERMRKDAERYRWLKENSDYVSTVVGNIEVTDEAIHAAMEGSDEPA